MAGQTARPSGVEREENRIDLADGGFGPGWHLDEFATFNAFFARQRDYDAYFAALRENGLLADVSSEPAELPAVADARLSVWPVGPDLAVPVKQSVYTLKELVGPRAHDIDLAPFEGGHCLVFRLGVDDYHRYVFPDSMPATPVPSRSSTRTISALF